MVAIDAVERREGSTAIIHACVEVDIQGADSDDHLSARSPFSTSIGAYAVESGRPQKRWPVVTLLQAPTASGVMQAGSEQG